MQSIVLGDKNECCTNCNALTGPGQLKKAGQSKSVMNNVNQNNFAAACLAMLVGNMQGYGGSGEGGVIQVGLVTPAQPELLFI